MVGAPSQRPLENTPTTGFLTVLTTPAERGVPRVLHNPIRLVRQGAKRKAAPNILNPDEIKTLIDGLAIRERTLVLLAASTGLRQSELFGLKWRDINFPDKLIHVTRSIVCGVVGPCKTESSQKPVPVHPLLIETLLKWKEQQHYRKPDDWVFARKRHRGRKPLILAFWSGPAVAVNFGPPERWLGTLRGWGNGSVAG